MKISDRIAQSRPLATTAMHGRADALRHAGEQVIDLSIAISHFPAPQAVRDVVRNAVDAEHPMPYSDVHGALGIREALAAKLRRENCIEAAPGEIIVTNGAKQAYYQALYAMTDPGDGLAVFRPYWPAYLASAHLLGLRLVVADLPETITPAVLDALGPVKVLVINNPHNPNGKVYTRQELEHVRDWALRSGAQVIADESYEHLIFEGSHTSLATLCDWRGIGVVTLFSASQSYAMMGWRVGFALAPAPWWRRCRTCRGRSRPPCPGCRSWRRSPPSIAGPCTPCWTTTARAATWWWPRWPACPGCAWRRPRPAPTCGPT